MAKWTMLFGAGVLTVAILAGASQSGAADEAITIEKVMQDAMKGGLCKKVVAGDASGEEKEQLVVLFRGLSAAEPPKGDLESWKAKTAALLQGAEAAVKGDATAADTLKSAANCKACHDVHRP